MEITFDKSADALYIAFRKGKFAKNKKVDADTILDLDSKGKLLGLEVLNASKRLTLKSMNDLKVEI